MLRFWFSYTTRWEKLAISFCNTIYQSQSFMIQLPIGLIDLTLIMNFTIINMTIENVFLTTTSQFVWFQLNWHKWSCPSHSPQEDRITLAPWNMVLKMIADIKIMYVSFVCLVVLYTDQGHLRHISYMPNIELFTVTNRELLTLPPVYC